jgi:O6-methylguanine-DNA--protein-cysteine methyltransferase
MSVTEFQMAVYNALKEVPKSKVTTYAALAARIGCGSS